ncbi:GAF domain-containing protein [Aeromicrobium sp. UC242_57]|uniref:GAF domain-containing protein n=1 Tax=Aeromicrobium sp. UC242_57 TaxID=3374624 RepID=UPI0037B7C354
MGLSHRGLFTSPHSLGAHTGALAGLTVDRGTGVGGRVLQDGRVIIVRDYAVSADISHDHDAAVRSEGLRTVIGAPVVVERTVRGVLYAGTRGEPTGGDRMADAVVREAHRLARDIEIDDEVNRRLAGRRSTHASAAAALDELTPLFEC